MANKTNSGYTGRIGLDSAQHIQAPITGPKNTKAIKATKVAKGGDLRSKGGK